MTEREIEFLTSESRQARDGIVDSTARVDNMLKRTAKIMERMRLLMDHQHTLDEAYNQSSDGARRRQLLEEMQKENRELHECKEANDALSKGLDEGFEMLNELMLRKREVEKRIGQEKNMYPLIKEVQSIEEYPNLLDKLYVQGEKEAEIKDKMRDYAFKVQSQMRLGEEDALILQERLTRLQTRNKGLKEAMTPEQKKRYNEMFNMIVPRVIEMNDFVDQADMETRKSRISELKHRLDEMREGLCEQLSVSDEIPANLSAIVEENSKDFGDEKQEMSEDYHANMSKSIVEAQPAGSLPNGFSKSELGDANLDNSANSNDGSSCVSLVDDTSLPASAGDIIEKDCSHQTTTEDNCSENISKDLDSVEKMSISEVENSVEIHVEESEA